MTSSHARGSERGHLAADRRPRIGKRAGRRLTCLLTTLHPERALSNALVQHLADELPDMTFTLRCEDPDVVWVCGYEAGADALVAELRVRHADAFLVVTGRGPLSRWESAVKAAGADFACGWPLPVEDLKRILRPTSPA